MKVFSLLILLFMIGYAQARVDGPPSAKDKEYGQTLVTQELIDQEMIEKFQRHVPSKPRETDTPMERLLYADSVDWRGTSIRAEDGKNPYKLVVTMTGTAIADGNALGVWFAGWRNDEGVSITKPFLGLGKMHAKAGERIVVTAASEPMRLTADKYYEPELQLKRFDNFALESVNVQIWSGVGEATPLEVLSAYRPLLFAAAVFFVWRWFRRM